MAALENLCNSLSSLPNSDSRFELITKILSNVFLLEHAWKLLFYSIEANLCVNARVSS